MSKIKEVIKRRVTLELSVESAIELLDFLDHFNTVLREDLDEHAKFQATFYLGNPEAWEDCLEETKEIAKILKDKLDNLNTT